MRGFALLPDGARDKPVRYKNEAVLRFFLRISKLRLLYCGPLNECIAVIAFDQSLPPTSSPAIHLQSGFWPDVR
jgi:hypothetical protein